MSGVMITGWFFLLHIPRFATDMQNASDRMGLGESLAIAGICFCIATAVDPDNLTGIPDALSNLNRGFAPPASGIQHMVAAAQRQRRKHHRAVLAKTANEDMSPRVEFGNHTY